MVLICPAIKAAAPESLPSYRSKGNTAVARSNNLPDVVAVLEKKLGVTKAGHAPEGDAPEGKVS